MQAMEKVSIWGRTCKAQMILLGKSLEDLSAETGYGRTYISAIINERVRVPEETREKISEALKVDVPYKPAI